MKAIYTIDEIKEKLKWFHGEEFDKYPFIDRASESFDYLKKVS